jgi:hypothetical protein
MLREEEEGVSSAEEGADVGLLWAADAMAVRCVVERSCCWAVLIDCRVSIDDGRGRREGCCYCMFEMRWRDARDDEGDPVEYVCLQRPSRER